MNNVYNNEIITINYKDNTDIIKYKNKKYKSYFNWRQYIDFYKDLNIDNIDDAWYHWTNHGIYENRNFFYNKDITDFDNNSKKNKHISIKNSIVKGEHVELIDIKNIIYKKNYNNYGLHFYGWEKVINNYLKKKVDLSNLHYKVFFDEWIEKLLIWGEKSIRNTYIKEINKKKYKMISFIHNPPFKIWYNDSYKKKIASSIIFHEEHTNENLFSKIKKYKLETKIIYLYALSNSHKEYIYKYFPAFKRNIISIYHPIEIDGKEEEFNYSAFLKNKNIFHIGWWLRNFKSFIDFKQPNEFKKTILIKDGFENEWNNISKNYNLGNVDIVKQLDNDKYRVIFTNSCIFLHVEDCVANNIILECIKFNTPIIVNKLPSIVEYLGEDYPLYVNNTNITSLQDINIFLHKIKKAHNYLKHMNKSHISIETFNNKLSYDLKKLEKNTEVRNKKLTWFCLIESLNDFEPIISKIYTNFYMQYNNSNLELKIIISSNLWDKFVKNGFEPKYKDINNIFFIFTSINSYDEFLNFCIEQTNTDYIVIVDKNDIFNANFSEVCINYLNNTPTCDIAFSNYIQIKEILYEYKNFNKDMMLFNSNFNKILFPETGVVWRIQLHKLLGKFYAFYNKKDILYDFFRRALQNNFNIMCCDSDHLYKTTIY
jgi:hypothetical protein